MVVISGFVAIDFFTVVADAHGVQLSLFDVS